MKDKTQDDKKHNMIFNTVFIAALILLVAVSACTNKTTSPPSISEMSKCVGFGGQYAADYKECTGITKEQCDQLSGTFNGCASACRHDPTAQICTMQCVIVCQLK